MVAQLRLIFKPSGAPRDEDALAYVQWFTNPTTSSQDDASLLFRVERKFDRQSGRRLGGVISLKDVVQLCPLSPRFGAVADDLGSDLGPDGPTINGDNAMELCNKFWINSFHDQLAYQTLW